MEPAIQGVALFLEETRCARLISDVFALKEIKKDAPGASFYYVEWGGLLNNAELFTYLGESCDSLVEVLAAVSCRELHADTSLILRNYRVVETSYVDALFGHTVGEVL